METNRPPTEKEKARSKERIAKLKKGLYKAFTSGSCPPDAKLEFKPPKKY